jgi:hypothetical protein
MLAASAGQPDEDGGFGEKLGNETSLLVVPTERVLAKAREKGMFVCS